MPQLITEDQAREMYHETLDMDGPVRIGTLTYSVSHVLREVDPVAYRCNFNDFVDYLTEDDIFVEGLTDSEMEPEDDGQPDEAQEWADFDPEC
jgi:hypothetical protein